MLKRFFCLSLVGIAISLGLIAQESSDKKLDLEDRMLDLEAQISSLKSELSNTKELAQQERANAFNPSISIVGDILGQYGIGVKKGENHDHDHGSHAHSFSNGLLLREAEFEFRAWVDPWADAVVVLGIEQHKIDHFELDLEEAYLRLVRWPGLGFAPLGIEIKAGKFKTAIGRINRIHLHNIPQITYPLAMRVFLGDEGFSSQGLSLNRSFATSNKSALSIYLEAVMGRKLPMQKKGSKEIPIGIAHAWWHIEPLLSHYIDFGFSAVLGRQGAQDSGLFTLLSADVHYGYIPPGYGQNPSFLFGSEFYAAKVQSAKKRWPMGNFTWLQARIMGPTFFGIRYDLAPKEDDLLSFQHAMGAFFTYYTTEFLRFRLGYEHVMPDIVSLKGDHRMMLSMIFILGSHPIEPYFINR